MQTTIATVSTALQTLLRLSADQRWPSDLRLLRRLFSAVIVEDTTTLTPPADMVNRTAGYRQCGSEGRGFIGEDECQTQECKHVNEHRLFVAGEAGEGHREDGRNFGRMMVPIFPVPEGEAKHGPHSESAPRVILTPSR